MTQEYPPYGSGIANVVYRLRNHLIKKGADVTILSRCGADVNVAPIFTNISGLMGLLPLYGKKSRNL